MKSMLSFIGKSSLWLWWLLIFGTVVLAFLELALVFTIPVFTNLILTDDFKSSEFLFASFLNKESLLTLMLGLTIVRFILQMILTKSSHRAFSKIYMQNVMILNSGYLKMNYLSFKELNLNDTLRNSTITISNATFGAERFFDAWKSLILIIALVLALGLYNITSLFIAIIASFIVAFLLKINKKPTAVAGQNTHDAQAKMQSLMAESYRSFKELKFHDNMAFYLKNVGSSIQDYYHNVSIARMLPKFPVIYMEAILYLTITVGFAYWSIVLGKNGLDILPSVVFYLFIIRKLLPSFNEVMHYFLDFKVNLPAINEINREKEKIKNNEEILPPEETLVFDKVELSDISFSYNSKRKILTDINLTINRGERIALLGKSGSGKSTLCEILSSLTDPKSGSFKINDNSVASLKPFRKEIGYLPQSFYVFSGTLLENILLSNLTPDQEKLERCINASMVSEFLPMLENGLNTLLGEQGNLLSGGQRQRVALARALYHSPQLLILDEATSSLDEEIEKQVLSNIHQHYSDLSIIFVTHRPKAVKDFDKRLKLEAGVLVGF